jgi:multidrug efflux system outer membrane protein
VSLALKRQQLASLESAVAISSKLFQNAQVEYLDVLTALRDRNAGRIVLIETKQEHLAAVVNAYQALGGGWRNVGGPAPIMPPIPQPPLRAPFFQRPGPPPEQVPAPPPGPEPVIQGPARPVGPTIPDPAPSKK